MRTPFRLSAAPWFTAMAAGLFFLSAMPALADACGTGVSMSATAVAFRPDYDFTDGAQHTTVVTSLRVMGVVAGCTYLVGAEGGNGGRKMSDGSAHTANYQLYTNSQLTDVFLDPLNGASGTDVNMLSFVGGSATTVTLMYYFTMPSGQYVPSGLYQDDVLLTLYSGTFLEPSPPIDSVSAIHEATVTGIFLVSLVPTGSAFDINRTSIVTDFGTLSPGQSRSVQALFKSNDSVGYKVYMRSDNASRLKAATGTASIPYSVTLSPSDSPNLAAVAANPALTQTDIQVASGTGVAPSSADRLNVTATIGSFSVPALAPGTYSDVITVTIVGN
ncbi:MAG: spore coat protein U domain-containing protein [Rhizomicrobium sp.]